MKINLMLPTRGRPDLCYRFCKSVADTAYNIENISVSLLCDTDDLSYSETINKLSEFDFINYLPQADVKEFPGLTWYWDQIIEQTINKTDIFGMIADDMVFRDKNWDLLITQFFNQIPDKIGLIHFNSHSPQGAKLCINSFVHKRYIEISGAYNDSRLKGDFSDDFLYYIFSSIDRLGYASKNVIEHMHYDYGKMEEDPTAIRRRASDGEIYDNMRLSEFFKKKSIPLANAYIKKLKRNLTYIQDKKKGLSNSLTSPEINYIPEDEIRNKYENKHIVKLRNHVKKIKRFMLP